MFLPNNRCIYKRRTGFTGTGEPLYGAPTEIRCSVIDMSVIARRTSVRADSSASRGAALEDAPDKIMMLFPKRAGVLTGDRIEIQNFELRIIGLQPRWAVSGELDHYEATLEPWKQ